MRRVLKFSCSGNVLRLSKTDILRFEKLFQNVQNAFDFIKNCARGVVTVRKLRKEEDVRTGSVLKYLGGVVRIVPDRHFLILNHRKD